VFSITLVWTDPPAETGAGRILVNDLDLTVTVTTADAASGYQEGTVIHANDLDEMDRVNNVENIIMSKDSSTPINLRVTVGGFNVPVTSRYNGQPFALVARGHWTTVAAAAPAPGELPLQTPAPRECFPATATVWRLGRDNKIDRIPMTDLHIGDLVAVQGGSFQPVFLFTHAVLHSPLPVVHLATSDTALDLSHHHLIPVRRNGTDMLVQAHHVVVGDMVLVATPPSPEALSVSETWKPVVARTLTHAVGAFAPLTLSGTIVVDGIAASCHSANPGDLPMTATHLLLLPFRLVYKAFPSVYMWLYPQPCVHSHPEREGAPWWLHTVRQWVSVKSRHALFHLFSPWSTPHSTAHTTPFSIRQQLGYSQSH